MDYTDRKVLASLSLNMPENTWQSTARPSALWNGVMYINLYNIMKERQG